MARLVPGTILVLIARKGGRGFGMFCAGFTGSAYRRLDNIFVVACTYLR